MGKGNKSAPQVNSGGAQGSSCQCWIPPPVADPSAHAANQLSPASPLPQIAFKTQIIIIKHHKNVTGQSKYTRTPNLLSLRFCPSPYKINFYNFYWQLQPGPKLFSDYCAHISQGRQWPSSNYFQEHFAHIQTPQLNLGQGTPRSWGRKKFPLDDLKRGKTKKKNQKT